MQRCRTERCTPRAHFRDMIDPFIHYGCSPGAALRTGRRVLVPIPGHCFMCGCTNSWFATASRGSSFFGRWSRRHFRKAAARKVGLIPWLDAQASRRNRHDLHIIRKEALNSEALFLEKLKITRNPLRLRDNLTAKWLCHQTPWHMKNIVQWRRITIEEDGSHSTIIPTRRPFVRLAFPVVRLYLINQDLRHKSSSSLLIYSGVSRKPSGKAS